MNFPVIPGMDEIIGMSELGASISYKRPVVYNRDGEGYIIENI